MKKRAIDGVSSKQAKALANSPEVTGFLALLAKVDAGAASPKERAEFAARTKRARALNPRVLVD